MDSDKPAPKKLRFPPKSQARRTRSSTAVPKTENVDDDDDKKAREKLLQRFNQESGRRQQPKVDNRAPAQVTFTNEAAQFTSTPRGFDGPRDGAVTQSSGLDLMQLDGNIGELSKPSSSIAGKGSIDDLSPKHKDYEEPWDYNDYYLTVVPWRPPYSGDPEILDEAEFGEAAVEVEYDETAINPASELGLLNPDATGKNERLLFFQLPESLPAVKRFSSAKGKEIADSQPPLNQRDVTAQRTCSLKDLAAGQMGKLLVYKSGAVKLKLGETLFTVSPGSDCTFAQTVATVNAKKREFCEMGVLDGRAIVTPDIDYLLNSVIDLG